MGRKKYFCDFCERHFNDDMNTRTKHLNSLSHLNLKREHYNLFRDPETILREESAKKPCRKFHCEGFCPFGGSCNFSHYSKEHLDALKEEINAKLIKEESEQPSIDAWLQKYYKSIESKKTESMKLLWSNVLPPHLMLNPGFLPPSMVPFHIKQFIDADLDTWG